ncbi:MAG: ribonuclease Z [Desulfobacterales bacterium]
MQPSFHPRLINGPFDDPGLFVPFQFEKRGMMFDLGDISRLPAKDILKIGQVFITHTHMDHMVGFDRLLRLLLGRDKSLHLYGPEGFLKNVEGKLAGYTWNLVKHYDARFSIAASEIGPTHLSTQVYPCHSGFIPDTTMVKTPRCPVVFKEPGLTVSAAILDHSIPSIGYCIEERFHINIRKAGLAPLGLEVGPWIQSFKEALFNGQDPESVFEVPCSKGNETMKRFGLGELSTQIALITPGQKVTYLADAIYSRQNEEEMVALAMGSDHLFIEAAFLDRDSTLAEKKYHLTAGQAGTIAGKAGVKRFTLFHFSPRYQDEEHRFRQEAMAAYNRYRPSGVQD